MGLADQAQLAATMSLNVKGQQALDRIDARLGKMDANLGKVRSSVSRTGLAIGNALGIGLDRVVTAGVRTFFGAIRDGEQSLQALQAANAQTGAVIKSTGGAAGISAQKVRDLAESYEDLNAIIDDKVIQAGENVLLTFRNIRKDAFEPALKASLDLATAMHEDLSSAALQVGKALNDPVRGLLALRRVGVQFTEAQEKQIKALVKTGDVMGAQKLIIAELDKEFGGSFLAQGNTSAGKVAKLNDAIEDLKRTFVTGLAPGIDSVRTKLTTLFKSPEFLTGAKSLGDKIAGFLSSENIDKAFGILKDGFRALQKIPFGTIADGLRITGQATKTVVDAFLSLPPDLQKVAIAALAVNKVTGGLVTSGIGALAKLALSSLTTITAANVTVVGASVTGGGIPGAAGGVAGAAGGGVAGAVKGAVKFVLPIGFGVIIANAIREAAGITPQQSAEQQSRGQFGPRTQGQATQPVTVKLAPSVFLPLAPTTIDKLGHYIQGAAIIEKTATYQNGHYILAGTSATKTSAAKTAARLQAVKDAASMAGEKAARAAQRTTAAVDRKKLNVAVTTNVLAKTVIDGRQYSSELSRTTNYSGAR